MQKKAEELEAQTVRPVYEIPASVQAYLTTAQQMALQGMPEEQRKVYLDQINRNAAYSIAGNVDRNVGLQGVSSANMALNDANANLLAMDSQQRMANINSLQQARLAYGAYEDQAFDYNKNQPYQLNAAAIRALKGAAEQAKFAGAQTVANAGSNFAGQAGTAMQTIDTQGNGNVGNQRAIGVPSSSYGNNPPTQKEWENANPYQYYVPNDVAPTPNNPYYYNTGTVDPN